MRRKLQLKYAHQSVHSCAPSFQLTLEKLPLAQGVQLYRAGFRGSNLAKYPEEQ